MGDNIMGHTASHHHTARDSQEALRRDRVLAAEFKPLALPALAAAVHASKQNPRRAEAKREVPAILREDAVLG
jgi:hypothetical protein